MQEELDQKIATLRMEKLMLLRTKEKCNDKEELFSIEKKIIEVNLKMKDLRKKYKEKILKEKGIVK